jgi:hypothetical protein
MFNGLVDAVDSLLAFASKHRGELLNPSTFLTPEQMQELTALDIAFHAHCQLSGLPLSIIPEPVESGLSRFGHSKLPYRSGILHLPIKDGAGKVTHDLVGGGTVIVPTPEWKHALMSLRATAALKAKIQENGKTMGPSTPSVGTGDQGASLDTPSEKKDKDDHRAGSKSVKRRRGRPAGSKTQAHDRKLYEDWKVAERQSGMTKEEFLHASGLPASDLAAIERGRKAIARNKGRLEKNGWK